MVPEVLVYLKARSQRVGELHLGDVNDMLGRWSQRETAAWLGRWLYELGSTSVTSLPTPFAEGDWRAAARARYGDAPALLAQKSLLPPRLIEAPPSLAATPRAAVRWARSRCDEPRGLRRAARTRATAVRASSFRASCVVGLDSLGTRHAMWDFGTIWWSFLRGDADLT